MELDIKYPGNESSNLNRKEMVKPTIPPIIPMAK